MPVNIPVTLTATQSAAVTYNTGAGTACPVAQSVTPTRNAQVGSGRVSTQSSASALNSAHGKILGINESATVSVTEIPNLFVLTIIEAPIIRAQRNISHATSITQASALARTSNALKPNTLTESTSLSMTSPSSHTRIFLITENTALALSTPALSLTLAVAETVHVTRTAGVNFPMLINESTALALINSKSNTLVLIQNTNLSKTGNVRGGPFRITEASSVSRNTSFNRTLSINEHTLLRANHSSTHQFSVSETMSVSRLADTHKTLSMAESVLATLPNRVVTHISSMTETIAVSLDRAAGMIQILQEPVHPSVHSLTDHQSFTIAETTAATHGAGVNPILALDESISIQRGSTNIKHYIPVTIATVPFVDAPQLIRLTFPVMGAIYQPTDIFGQQVQVISKLADYYYWFNTDDIPSLYWNSSDLSHDTTNDTYQPWKTK